VLNRLNARSILSAQSISCDAALSIGGYAALHRRSVDVHLNTLCSIQRYSALKRSSHEAGMAAVILPGSCSAPSARAHVSRLPRCFAISTRRPRR
jgi:hypothetical protein